MKFKEPSSPRGPKFWLGLGALLLAGLLWYFVAGRGGGQGPLETQLFTGKEPKRAVKLYFPSSSKPGFVVENAEIYLTPSKSSQFKQVVDLLIKGPRGKDAAPALPKETVWREAFLNETAETAVVDFEPSLAALHPGGTSSEYATVFCLVRSILDNFKEARRLQILIGGAPAESLAGHFDISRPLALQDF